MTFIKGELRQVGIEVTSTVGEDFIIDSASYDVFKVTDTNTSLDSGSVGIDGHKLIMLFSATVEGTFFVEFTYRIKTEILKARVTVEVK